MVYAKSLGIQNTLYVNLVFSIMILVDLIDAPEIKRHLFERL